MSARKPCRRSTPGNSKALPASARLAPRDGSMSRWFDGLSPIAQMVYRHPPFGNDPGKSAWHALQRARLDQSFPSPGEQGNGLAGTVWMQMKRIVNTSEVLGTVETPEGSAELCACADAN